jgi:hypothetical protein
MAIDNRKIKGYEAILNMCFKALFGVGSFIAFFIVLYFWINSKTNFDLIKFGSMEVFFAATFYLPFRHYFGFTRKS